MSTTVPAGTTPRFRRKELVDVTIRAAEIYRVSELELVVWARVVNEVGMTASTISVSIPLTAANVTVSRVAPAEWPPKVGDLWRDREGTEWLCQEVTRGSATTIEMAPSVGAAYTGHTPAQLLQELGPLELLYRRPERADCTEQGDVPAKSASAAPRRPQLMGPPADAIRVGGDQR